MRPRRSGQALATWWRTLCQAQAAGLGGGQDVGPSSGQVVEGVVEGLPGGGGGEREGGVAQVVVEVLVAQGDEVECRGGGVFGVGCGGGVRVSWAAGVAWAGGGHGVGDGEAGFGASASKAQPVQGARDADGQSCGSVAGRGQWAAGSDSAEVGGCVAAQEGDVLGGEVGSRGRSSTSRSHRPAGGVVASDRPGRFGGH